MKYITKINFTCLFLLFEVKSSSPRVAGILVLSQGRSCPCASRGWERQEPQFWGQEVSTLRGDLGRRWGGKEVVSENAVKKEQGLWLGERKGEEELYLRMGNSRTLAED